MLQAQKEASKGKPFNCQVSSFGRGHDPSMPSSFSSGANPSIKLIQIAAFLDTPNNETHLIIKQPNFDCHVPSSHL